MSLMDDIKEFMRQAGVSDNQTTFVLSKLSKKHGGNKLYVRKKENRKK